MGGKVTFDFIILGEASAPAMIFLTHSQMSWVPKIGDLSNEYSGSHGNVVDLLLRRCMFCSVSRISHGWDQYGYVQIVRGVGGFGGES